MADFPTSPHLLANLRAYRGSSSSSSPSVTISTFKDAVHFLSTENIRGHSADVDVSRKQEYLDCSAQLLECLIGWRQEMPEEGLSRLPFWESVVSSVVPLLISSLRELSFEECFHDSGRAGDDLVVMAFFCNMETILYVVNEYMTSEVSEIIKKDIQRRVETTVALRYINSILGNIELSLKDLMTESVHEKLYSTRKACKQYPSKPSSMQASSSVLMDFSDPILEDIVIKIDPSNLYKNSLFGYFASSNMADGKANENSNERIISLKAVNFLNVLQTKTNKLLEKIQCDRTGDEGAEELIMILKVQGQLPLGGCVSSLCCTTLFSLLSFSYNQSLIPNLSSATWIPSGAFTALATFCIDLVVSHPEPDLHNMAVVLLCLGIQSTTSSNVVSSASLMITKLMHRLGALSGGMYRFIAMRCIYELLIASSPSLSFPSQPVCVEKANTHQENKVLPKFQSLVAKSTTSYLHTYIQQLNNLITSHKDIDEIYFVVYGLRMYFTFCPSGVLLCQMSYIQEMISNIIAPIIGPALNDNPYVISTMIMLLQTIIIISESISLEGIKIVLPKFFVYVLKCRILSNSRLKVTSNLSWRKLHSLCDFWVESFVKKHSSLELLFSQGRIEGHIHSECSKIISEEQILKAFISL